MSHNRLNSEYDQSKQGFEVLDHTADIAMRIWAPRLNKLLEESARALTAIMISGIIKCERSVQITIDAENEEELFLRWLREVLFLFECGLVLAESRIHTHNFTMSKTGPLHFSATVTGEKLEPARHDICMEIKAITRHGLSVKKKGSGWEAQVLYDI